MRPHIVPSRSSSDLRRVEGAASKSRWKQRHVLVFSGTVLCLGDPDRRPCHISVTAGLRALRTMPWFAHAGAGVAMSMLSCNPVPSRCYAMPCHAIEFPSASAEASSASVRVAIVTPSYLPRGPITLPTITAASLSQLALGA